MADAKERKQRKEKIWLEWFTPSNASWVCKRHGFQDVEGGLCPSCTRYAFSTAYNAGVCEL